MSAEPLAVRVDGALARWVKAYARDRECSQGAIVEAALISFREDCRAGVPELPSGRGARVRPRAASPRPMPPASVPVPAPAVPAVDPAMLERQRRIAARAGLDA